MPKWTKRNPNPGNTPPRTTSAPEMSTTSNQTPSHHFSDDGTSAAAALPLLDKLCAGVTGPDLFLKEYQPSIAERKKTIRAELSQSGGVFNAAGVYQQARKEVWISLPEEEKMELWKRAKEMNSNVYEYAPYLLEDLFPKLC